MILVVCIDKKGGLQFNHRRQSRDSLLIEDLIREADGRIIRTSPYSAPLFPEGVAKDGAEDAGVGELCFYEGDFPCPPKEKLEGVILYHWNRAYPADLWFDESLLDGMKKTGKTDFPGSSHEKITKEVYRK